MENGEDAFTKAEKVLETKPYRTYETLSRLFGPVFFALNAVVAIGHFFFTPVPENAPSVVIGKAIFFAISTCGAFGMAVAAVMLVRSIFSRKRGLRWYDIAAGIPLFILLMIPLWYYKASPSLMTSSVTLGFGCFIMLFILPALHKHKIINLN